MDSKKVHQIWKMFIDFYIKNHEFEKSSRDFEKSSLIWKNYIGFGREMFMNLIKVHRILKRFIGCDKKRCMRLKKFAGFWKQVHRFKKKVHWFWLKMVIIWKKFIDFKKCSRVFRKSSQIRKKFVNIEKSSPDSTKKFINSDEKISRILKK